MSTIQTVRRKESVMRSWFAEVSTAAVAFEARWTWPTLDRIDPRIAGLLRQQRALFDLAIETGSNEEIEAHGASMCRGYRVACGAMERVEAADTAYQLGTDIKSGVRVAIGIQKAATTRLGALHGQGEVIFVTPDEVAEMIAASADKACFIATVKRKFPGSVMG
jgi:hypothetical protein